MAEALKHKHAGKEQNTPWWKRWWARTAAVISFVAAIVTIVAYVQGYLPHHGPEITFTDPQPNEVSQERCVFSVSGRGTPRAGQVLVLSNQVQGTGDNVDPLLHLVVATMKPGTDQIGRASGGGRGESS